MTPQRWRSTRAKPPIMWQAVMAASTAKAQGAEPYAVVMFTIAGMLALGAAAFRWLPAPRQQV